MSAVRRQLRWKHRKDVFRFTLGRDSSWRNGNASHTELFSGKMAFSVREDDGF